MRDTFVFEGKAGATYDFISTSYFDPFLLELFDNKGNVIAVDNYNGTDGNDYVIDFVAPYDGKYYVNASWHQGLADKTVSLLVEEDVDTIELLPDPPIDPIPPIPPLPDSDRIFNWAESKYPILFPEHPQSHDIFGYYAREYSNGDALGVKNDNIYFYDGGVYGTGDIILIGTISDYMPLVTSAGF